MNGQPGAQRTPVVRDLLIISVLSGIGGVMSAYVGYLGNLVNRMVGVPFGAGQFVAGLHVFWLLMASGLVPRMGTATAAGVLKGTVEFLSGSTHGMAIILVSAVQGLCVDVVFLLVRKRSLFTYGLAGSIAAASNVFVFQALYFANVPWGYILGISALAIVSGATLGGAFVWGFLGLLQEIKPVRMKSSLVEERRPHTSQMTMVVSLLLALALAGGAAYYFYAIYEAPWLGPELTVSGLVNRPGTFALEHFASEETTIVAELTGQVTHVTARSYTGIPVHAILNQVEPSSGATILRVAASDGYAVDFDLEEVRQDDDMLLINDEGELRLIAGAYEGGYWVRSVTRFELR